MNYFHIKKSYQELQNSTFVFYRLDYKKSTGLDGTPTLVNGDGDGTVNARSLKACGEWKDVKGQNGKNVTLQDFPKVDHMTVLSDARIVKYILDVMLG